MAHQSNSLSDGTDPAVAEEFGAKHMHGDAHGHGGLVEHHFVDIEQQHDAGVLGMWVFLATEVMFIGAIFVAYFCYRLNPAYFGAFKAGSENLVTWIGAVNTAVLLTSSLTVVLAIRAVQRNEQKHLFVYLILTIILGAAFFGFKVLEYYTDYQEHLWPATGAQFEPEKSFKHIDPDGTVRVLQNVDYGRMFFRFYYTLTALHAFHMLVGLGIFIFLAVQAKRGKYTPESHQQVEICGLYWHFVDLVWIFLFPLLYLIR